MTDVARPAIVAPEHTGLRGFLSRPLFWATTAYLAMGIPFNAINGTASTMFKSLGFSDTEITIALGNIIIVWSLKPLWAAFLDMYASKRSFVLASQLLLAILFCAIAMSLPFSDNFQICIALLWVAAFVSATQDICADGIILTASSRTEQAQVAGFLSMAWNVGKILATGALIAGMELLARSQGWQSETMWMGVWILTGALMIIMFAINYRSLPAGAPNQRPDSVRTALAQFIGTANTIFHKRAFWGMIGFILLYRFGEGLIMTEGKLFLQSSVESGGLGLSAGETAAIDAVYGSVAFIVGGILGGLCLSKVGLRRGLPLFAICLNVPHLTFVYLSQMGGPGHTMSFEHIALVFSIEKFGYGFGFMACIVYMMQQFAPGRTAMTHYACSTALMNFVLVPTTMISGPLAETFGFPTFFLIVMLASIPSIWVAIKAPFPIGDDAIVDDGRPLLVTQDDPIRLTPTEIAVQHAAGRASLYAMLHILIILVLDTSALGAIKINPAASMFPLGLIIAGIVAKVTLLVLTLRSFALARNAAKVVPGSAYLANAQGAIVATVAAMAVSVAVLALALSLAGKVA